MRGAAPFVLVVFVVLAGCSGSAAKGATTTSLAPAPPPTVSSETGSIEGLVTDTEHVPIPGVTVGLVELSHTQTSDAGGRFVFNNLSAGSFKVVTQKLGYESSAKKVDVTLGQVAKVTFVMAAISLTPEPFVQMLPFVGMIQCSVSAQYAVYPCGGVTGEDKVAFELFTNKNWTLSEAVMELVWTPNNAATGQELEFDLCKYTAARMKTLCDGAFSADGADNYKYKAGGPPIVLRADKLDWKKNEHWITGAGAAIASAYPVYQQSFKIYASLCYYAACADDYSAVPK
jgi:hypothetical protein